MIKTTQAKGITFHTSLEHFDGLEEKLKEILYEGSLKKDLDLDTEKQKMDNKFTLIGDRVLVALDEALDHTQTKSGLFIPLNTLKESESGKMTTETSKRKHLSQGTIVQLGSKAVSNFNTLGEDPKVGDKVMLSEQALNSSYHFYPDRSRLVQDFQGYVCIPHTLIEAIIND